MSVATSIKLAQLTNLVRQQRHCRREWTYRKDKCTPPDPLSSQGVRRLASISLETGFLSPEPPHSLDSRDGLGRVLGVRVADSLRRSGGVLSDMPFRASAAAAACLCHGMARHGEVRSLSTWRAQRRMVNDCWLAAAGNVLVGERHLLVRLAAGVLLVAAHAAGGGLVRLRRRSESSSRGCR